MKTWNSFPMLRLIFPFVLGVVAGAFISEVVRIDVKLLCLTLFGFSIVIIPTLIALGNLTSQRWFGLLVWPSFLVFGTLLALSVSDGIYPDYIHAESDGTPHEYVIKIVDEPQGKANSVKVVADAFDVQNSRQGKLLLYFSKDSLSSNLSYGQKLLVRTKIEQVAGLGNPNEFNYSRYLRFHNIHFRGYVQDADWRVVSNGEPSLKRWFLDLRSSLIERLKEAGLSGNELSVASALILGHRTDLDKELLTAYAGAGATHVLAVSGLHVGIVYLILNFLLRFLNRFKYGRFVRTLLVVLTLFSYAALTGLSASVFRAATMFSFVAIGTAFNRNTNIFNTLAASAFCLILYEPMILMQVGFQLSYAAVIGIVLIQPLLFQLYVFKNRLLDWAWSIT